VKILRLSRIINYLKSSDDVKMKLKLGKTFFFLLLYVHLTGCAWIFICGISNGVMDYIESDVFGCNLLLPPGTWIPDQWALYQQKTGTTKNFYC